MGTGLTRAFLCHVESETVTGPAGSGATPQAGSEEGTGQGYPAGTAPADMTPEQQAAYWQARAHKQGEQLKTLPGLKAKADAYDKHVAESATEQERALAAARADGAAEALRGQGNQYATQMLNLLLTARDVTPEQREAILIGFNPAPFISDDGSIDDEQLAAWAALFTGAAAPAATDRWAAKVAGSRPGHPPVALAQAGIDEANRRFASKA